MLNNFKYKYLFGPVPSRRLGMSLGVDLVPHKTCSLNCVYCECGKTTNLTIERKEYVPTDVVMKELHNFLNAQPELDFITFSGAGEPTLHAGLGRIARFLKDQFPLYRIALLTNGTLFYQPGLIDEISTIDVIVPSLDAVTESTFKKLNRPHSQLRIPTIIDSLIHLRSQYTGQIWLEIFIVPGLNDSNTEIERLKETIDLIKPDRIQLNSLDRPGTAPWVRPASQELLQKIAGQLGSMTEIIARFDKKQHVTNSNTNIENAIVQLIKRRPCTVDDMISSLGLHELEINKYLRDLVAQHKIQSEKIERGTFYRIIENE